MRKEPISVSWVAGGQHEPTSWLSADRRNAMRHHIGFISSNGTLVYQPGGSFEMFTFAYHAQRVAAPPLVHKKDYKHTRRRYEHNVHMLGHRASVMNQILQDVHISNYWMNP